MLGSHTEPNEPESAWSQDRQAICAHKNRVAGPPSEMGASRLAEGGSEMLSKALEVPYLVNDKAGFETSSSTATVLHPLPSLKKTNQSRKGTCPQAAAPSERLLTS